MTHTKIQQKSNDSLHQLRFGRLKTDFEDLEPPVVVPLKVGLTPRK